MAFDEWTAAVNERFKHKDAVDKELCGICRELLKRIDALEEKWNEYPVKEEK